MPAQSASEARPGGGRRALLHSSQIAAIYTSDIKLASRASQWEYGRRYPVKQGMRCTMQRMRTSRREIEISYARADKRDKVYDQLVAAIAPALTLEGLAPFVPELPEEEEARKPRWVGEQPRPGGACCCSVQPLRWQAGHSPMKTLLLPTLLAAGTLLTAPAHAQRAFQVGPTVGATLSTVHFDDVPDRTAMPLRAGFAAGLTGSYQSPGHWGVQVAGLFVQQGYTQRYESPTGDYQHTTYLRLNYLRLPLQLTFSAHPSGRGLRFFAGPYVGALLGGQHIEESTYQGVRARNRGQVMVADTRHQEVLFVIDPVYQPEYTRYSRRFDVGLQGGVGYQVGPARLQVGYTLGLRNLAATTVYQVGTSSFAEVGDPYRTRGLEASLTYLFGPKG